MTVGCMTHLCDEVLDLVPTQGLLLKQLTRQRMELMLVGHQHLARPLICALGTEETCRGRQAGGRAEELCVLLRMNIHIRHTVAPEFWS
jgi:hypothetical protein